MTLTGSITTTGAAWGDKLCRCRYRHNVKPNLRVVVPPLASVSTCTEDERKPLGACTLEFAPVVGFDQLGNSLGISSNRCSACRAGALYTIPVTECPEERPQICTADFRPTTGYDAGGKIIMDDHGSIRVYGNPCNACADVNVHYWHEGPPVTHISAV